MLNMKGNSTRLFVHLLFYYLQCGKYFLLRANIFIGDENMKSGGLDLWIMVHIPMKIICKTHICNPLICVHKDSLILLTCSRSNTNGLGHSRKIKNKVLCDPYDYLPSASKPNTQVASLTHLK